MNGFEFRKAIPFGKKEEKPPAFDASKYEQYALTGEDSTDPKIKELLEAKKHIEFYQESGNGTRDDEIRIEELDKQIAARITELSN
jgi:hypothetical protein